MENLPENDWLLSATYVPPTYWAGHAPFLKYLISVLRPKNFVELGVEYGFSYFIACEAIEDLDLDCKAFAVDNWQGDPHVGVLGEDVYNSVLEENSKYSKFSELLKETFTNAAKKFEENSIDILHIDGTHTYDAVREDFFRYLPKMAENGVILLHDVAVLKPDFGVFKFWQEISQDYETINFSHSSGLGVIFLGRSKLKFLASLPSDISGFQISSFFATHGDQFFRKYYYQNLVHEKEALVHEKEALVHEKESINHLYEAIYNSTSWKITSPLRWIKAKLMNKR